MIFCVASETETLQVCVADNGIGEDMLEFVTIFAELALGLAPTFSPAP